MRKCQWHLHPFRHTTLPNTLSRQELPPNGKRRRWPSSCMRTSGLEKIRRRLQTRLGWSPLIPAILSRADRHHSIHRITLAYSDPGLASVELVQAILRQGTFVEKMVNMGWTTEGRFDAPQAQATLISCITRYHGFLCLMATIPGHMLVPTLVSPSFIPTLYLSDFSCRI